MSQRKGRVYGGVEIDQPIFDESGEELGRVRGLDSAGFYVLATGSKEHVPITDVRDITGTAYLMWRCWNCGEMGEIEDNLPNRCPNCNAPKEDLYYWAED